MGRSESWTYVSYLAHLTSCTVLRNELAEGRLLPIHLLFTPVPNNVLLYNACRCISFSYMEANLMLVSRLAPCVGEPQQGSRAEVPRMAPRLTLFDVLKGLLIILVVIGHFMHPVHNDNPVMSAGFDVIYLFYMPLFVFVSGLFAKGAYRDGKLNVNRIISYVVLGIAFQAALLVINGQNVFSLRLLRFSSAPWYFIAMAWWYACLPVLHELGARRGLVATSVLALLWGAVDLSGGFLAISRAIAFLPWFAAGYYLRPQSVIAFKKRHPVLLAGAVMLFMLIVVARCLDPHSLDFFFQRVYGDTPYMHGVVRGMLEKLVASAIALICSLAVLKLLPEHAPRLEALGRRTLQVYVLHRLVRAALTFRIPLYKQPVMLDPLLGTIIVLACSAVVIVVCAALPVSDWFSRVVHHKWLSGGSS